MSVKPPKHATDKKRGRVRRAAAMMPRKPAPRARRRACAWKHGGRMGHVIELNPAQSARTIEQAVRHRATVLLDPRVRVDPNGLKGRLIAADERILRVEITESPALGLAAFVGAECDASLVLGQDTYLFGTQVLRIASESSEPVAEVACPRRLGVQERRRFWRVQFAHSSEVRLRWGSAGRASGWLCNLSGDGLACRVDGEDTRELGPGAKVYVDFDVPDCDRHFQLEAVICNRTPGNDPHVVMLSMQFLDPASSGACGPTRELHEFLRARCASRAADLVEAGHVLGGSST